MPAEPDDEAGAILGVALDLVIVAAFIVFAAGVWLGAILAILILETDMGNLIAIGTIVIVLAGGLAWLIHLMREGAALKVENKVLDKTTTAQRGQLDVAKNAPKTLDELDKQLRDGGAL